MREVHSQRLLATAERAEVRHRPAQANQAQQALDKPCRLPSAMPNNTFIVRQVWMAAALQTACRPRLPVAVASHFLSGSNQIVSERRRLSALL